MKKDILNQMSEALADQYDGASAAPEATRARVIRTLAERRPRRTKWWTVGIPAFLLLGGSTAWASVTGHLPAVVEAIAAVVESGDFRVFKQASALSTKKAPVSNSAAVPLPSDARSSDNKEFASNDDAPLAEPRGEPLTLLQSAKKIEDSTTAERQSKTRRKKENPKTRNTSTKARELTLAPDPPSLPPQLDPSLKIYQKAHRAQFREGQCQKAVVIYQNYLTAAPSGSFAVDARYNRGVCLIRLGRHAEAKGALQPFADGKYGSYRQGQSAKLLEALR